MNLDLPSVTSIIKGAEDDARNLRSVGWEPETGDLTLEVLNAGHLHASLPAIHYFAARRIQEDIMPRCLLRLYVFVFTRKWDSLAPKDPTP